GDEVGGGRARTRAPVAVGVHRQHLRWLGRLSEGPPVVVVEPDVAEVSEKRVAKEKIRTVKVLRKRVPFRRVARAGAPEVVTVGRPASAIEGARRPFDGFLEGHDGAADTAIVGKIDETAGELVPIIEAHPCVSIGWKRY